MRKVIILIIIILAAGYLGQTQKATAVNALRLKIRYERREISKEQYEALIKKNTFLNNLLNLKLVASVD